MATGHPTWTRPTREGGGEGGRWRESRGNMERERAEKELSREKERDIHVGVGARVIQGGGEEMRKRGRGKRNSRSLEEGESDKVLGSATSQLRSPGGMLVFQSPIPVSCLSHNLVSFGQSSTLTPSTPSLH